MSGEQRSLVHKRRTRAEVQQLVAEFIGSGMRRSEFCCSHGLSFSTLDRHLKNSKKHARNKWNKASRSSSASDRLLPVEVAAVQHIRREPSSGLSAVVSGNRWIEVRRNFDVETFQRLLSLLERA
jgi:hypothetical protein